MEYLNIQFVIMCDIILIAIMNLPAPNLVGTEGPRALLQSSRTTQESPEYSRISCTAIAITTGNVSHDSPCTTGFLFV